MMDDEAMASVSSDAPASVVVKGSVSEDVDESSRTTNGKKFICWLSTGDLIVFFFGLCRSICRRQVQAEDAGTCGVDGHDAHAL